jgi:hypothetical protein
VGLNDPLLNMLLSLTQVLLVPVAALLPITSRTSLHHSLE